LGVNIYPRPASVAIFFRHHVRARSGTALCYCWTIDSGKAGDWTMDLILIALLGLLLATLLAFFLGVIPYPYGLIVLAALIAGRILYLRGPRKPR